MSESIPCSECGLYYSHRQRCSYWTKSSSYHEYQFREAEQLFAPKKYELEMKIKELEEQINECLKQNHKLQSEIEEQDQKIKEAREVIEKIKLYSEVNGLFHELASAYLEKWK